MADSKEDGQSGATRYFTRKRSKSVKTVEVVELSDSSSDCNDDDCVPNESNSASSNKSLPLPEQTTMECPVCLQACMHPARLPCGHIFCFLCLKGIAQQSKRCAMCRHEISPDYLDHPDLLDSVDEVSSKEEENEYQWFYEGRNGWWQYDERTSRELETSYNSGIRSCELLIAGFLYTADFDSMVQMRRNESHRRRRIKRDLATIPKKGVAGIRHIVNVDSVLEQFSSLTLSDNPVQEQ